MKIAGMLAILLIIGLGSGCVTLESEQRAQEEAHFRMQVQYMQDDVTRLQARVEALEASEDGRRQELRQVRTRVEAQEATLGTERQRLEQALADERAARQKEKVEVVQTISARVAEMVHQSQPVGGGSGEGLEHVVKTGETLSDIARAYKVTVPVIVKANKLGDANSIRVGQKLFIPQ